MFDAADHTFVVCAYGESEYLRECVDSLLEQRVKTNIIIATSTPNPTIIGIAESAGIDLKVNPEGKGIASDWNFALSQVSTPLATIAHQDDVYLPDYARRAIEGMNKVKTPLLFFSNYGELRDGEPVDYNSLLRVKRAMLSPLANGRLASSKMVRRRILSFGSAICCPAVTMCLPNLPSPVFWESMKNNLDWQAWERVSKLDGAFYYDTDILMRHRIHGGSETTHLIKDGTRSNEDLEMFELFWPKPIAVLLNAIYSRSQISNS